VGATGGGFILSRGVHTAATFVKGPSRRVEITVNGDKNYPAATTKRAIELIFCGNLIGTQPLGEVCFATATPAVIRSRA